MTLRLPAFRVVLASQSPRRADLLRAAGVAFEVVAVPVDESMRAGESASAYVRRLAMEKAEAGFCARPDAVALGADTAVVVDGTVLGKPVDAADAAHMLRALNGRGHEVITGVALAGAGGTRAEVALTTVVFRRIGDDELGLYAAGHEVMDKAGAYAIQGGAARFVTEVVGSYTNVVGLPIALVCRMLSEYPEANSL